MALALTLPIFAALAVILAPIFAALGLACAALACARALARVTRAPRAWAHRLADAVGAGAREWELARVTGSGARIGWAWARMGFWRVLTDADARRFPPTGPGARVSDLRASLAGARARAQARRKTRIHSARATVWASVAHLCESLACSDAYDLPRLMRRRAILPIFNLARSAQYYNAIQAQKWGRLCDANGDDLACLLGELSAARVAR